MSSIEKYSDSFFQQGQIRLAELSVFNWGSFDRLHTAEIDPFGTLITGDNGAGKSTFVDGLMALLLPAGKATFNIAAAQGDRADRSLLSYMRGSFGSAHDGSGTRVKSKREKAVVTGLRALYLADDGSEITLAALFWTTQASNSLSDVKRIYVVAKRNLQLKEMLDAFGEGSAATLKRWMRDDPRITCCDDNFSDYQELYRKLLYMDNKNAPALLSRALGLKKIDDLTKLIRELVLEPSSVKDDAKKVVDEFADLVAIHDKLSDARAQVEHLQRLPSLADDIRQAREALERLHLEKNNLRIYFGEVLAELWSGRVQEIIAKLESIEKQLEELERKEVDAEATVERRHGEYLAHGGDQVESLKKEIHQAKEKLTEVGGNASRYQQDAQTLGLSASLLQDDFLDSQGVARTQLDSIGQDTEASQNYFAEISGELGKTQEEARAIEEQIQETEARPDSNIDRPYQLLRDELVMALELPADQLMFIGELMDVQEEERPWQGAIERALGGLRTTLLVPASGYSMVTRWLNSRHTGLHVRVQVVRHDRDKSSPPEFLDNGFLRKLVWRTHAYRDWLKHHLSRYDMQCVSSTDELDATPFSMTREGLVQKERGRFEKKDQHKVGDRRRWCLGFSNKARLGLLRSDKAKFEKLIEELLGQVSQARKAMNTVSDRKSILERLLAWRWEDIDAPYWQARLEGLKLDLGALEASQGDLAQALVRWEEAKIELKAIQGLSGQRQQEKGRVENELESAKNACSKAQELASTGLTDECRTLLARRVGVITLDRTERQAEVDRELDAAIGQQQSRKSAAENSANGIMGSFRGKDQWAPIVAEWGTGLGALDDYLAHLDNLKQEGLPSLVEQFRQRLNKHATQSLARIKTKLDSEREDILERIETINAVLRKTEFRAGSHLKLGTRREKYPHVQEFDRKLRTVLSQVTSEEHEQRFEALAEVVSILDKASSTGTSGSMESLRLLDPRYQMTFFAEEVDSTTQEIRDVLDSSSGKSGGEKESFAGIVVAASLAYVLTPDGYDRPVYSTVFLDEAFSNTAESVSRRVLRVFKELNIHVNLITPYKNLNLARESARSLLIAERNADTHESHLCEVTWEEIDKKLAASKKEELLNEAQSLGVQIDD